MSACRPELRRRRRVRSKMSTERLDSRLGGDLRQLTGLDAQFLALETPRQSGHFSGLTILDPSTRPNGRLELADVQRWRHHVSKASCKSSQGSARTGP